MSLIDKLGAKLQRHPKRVVFPEGNDPRIMQAARSFATKRFGVPILLGDRSEIKSTAQRLNIKLDGIRIVEPERSEDWELFLPMFQDLPRFSEFDIDRHREILLQKNYFATLMLATGRADALVSGATSSASSALRPLFQIIPKQEHVNACSSMLILDLEDSKLGMEGTLFLADCGVIPEPTEDQLADIAITTSDIASHLTNQLPRVAMLSYATKSRKAIPHPSIVRMRAATSLAREKAKLKGIEIEIEGELQVDAALVSFAAEQKGMLDNPVAGKANVLIFPDLNCGNIVSKMVQIVAETRSYGQIITGLTKPAAEISRGAHAHDILGTSIIVACQAIDKQFLYGTES
jgi:phosphate acetyltransferase